MFLYNEVDQVNIYDCFLFNQKVNNMIDNNAKFCKYCKNTANYSIKKVFCTGAEILIIILNNEKTFKVKFNFFEEINLLNFIEMNQTGFNYGLIGVISNLGGTDINDHFIAFCKNPITREWYKYDDSIVTPVDNFKSEIIDSVMPNILFYEKKK